MRINGPGRTETSAIRRAARADAGDAKAFVAEAAHDAQKAAALTGTGPIAAVDTILMLQGVEDLPGNRKQSIVQGERLLHLLDEVRDGLLAGGIPRVTLNRLAMAVTNRREGFAEPKLQMILDEIELRARVELAKLEQAERPLA